MAKTCPFTINFVFENKYCMKFCFRYKSVLHACALQPDIAMLPGGDTTEIGEKVITRTIILMYNTEFVSRMGMLNGQLDVKHIMTSPIKTIASVLTDIITNIPRLHRHYHKYPSLSYQTHRDTSDNVCLNLQHCCYSIYIMLNKLALENKLTIFSLLNKVC